MRADRLLSIMMTLQARGRVTAQELSEKLEVSERTIYRDLDSLSAAGVPVYADRGPGGGFALMEGYRSGLTALNDDEARALIVASIPGPLADLGMDKPLEDALLKLLATLPHARSEAVHRLRSLVHLDSSPWFTRQDETPHLPTAQRAVFESRRLEMIYRTDAGEVNHRIIEPYGLVAKSDIWYMVASTPRGMRVYRVGRIQSASVMAEYFTRPEAFDLAEFWEDWRERFIASLPVYPVRARVAPQLQDDLGWRFGDDIAESARDITPDAQGWLTLDLRFDNIHHACEDLLGLGAYVEVLEPPELRAALVDALGQMAALYGV